MLLQLKEEQDALTKILQKITWLWGDFFAQIKINEMATTLKLSVQAEERRPKVQLT